MAYPFDGHAVPKSNWTWVPPEFFQVILGARSSLHEARAVAHLLRRARGQETEHWLPQDAELQVSYGAFMRAGVPRSRIRATLDAMEAAGFISLVSAGCSGASAQAGVYQLRWSQATEPQVSACGQQLPNGFCGAIQQQIAVPNTFLDATMPECSMRVIQIVATFMLRCLGYSAADGIRRREVALSQTEIQRITGMDRRGVQRAIAEAIEARQIRMHVRPHYRSARAAVYGLCWQDGYGTDDQWPGPAGSSARSGDGAGDDGVLDDSGVETSAKSNVCTAVHIMQSKQGDGEAGSLPPREAGSFRPPGVDTLVHSDRGGGSDRPPGAGSFQPPGWFKLTAGSGPKLPPGAGSFPPPPPGSFRPPLEALALQAQEPKLEQQQQRPVVVETGVREGEERQQQPWPCAHELTYRLTDAGVDPRTAAQLVEDCAPEVIVQQLGWHGERGHARNPAGRLVASIQHRWGPPMSATPLAASTGSGPGPLGQGSASSEVVDFARGVYAGIAGVAPEHSVSEPDPLDARACNRLVAAIPSRFPGGKHTAADIGFALGQWAAEQHRRDYGKVKLGATAARIVNGYGDGFLAATAGAEGRDVLRRCLARLVPLRAKADAPVSIEPDVPTIPVVRVTHEPRGATDPDAQIEGAQALLQRYMLDPDPPAQLTETLRRLPWWPPDPASADCGTLATHLVLARCTREVSMLGAHYSDSG